MNHIIIMSSSRNELAQQQQLCEAHGFEALYPNPWAFGEVWCLTMMEKAATVPKVEAEYPRHEVKPIL